MAYETEKGNFITPTDAVQAIALEAAVQQQVVTQFVNDFGAAPNASMKLPIAGKFTAASVAESAAVNFAADHEYTETSATVSIAKIALPTKLTAEAKRFANARSDKAYLAKLQGEAIGRYLDSVVLGLATGFTGNTAISTYTGAALEPDAIFDAETSLATANTIGQTNVIFLSPKGVNDIRDAILASTGTVWANPQMPTFMNGYNVQTKVAGMIGNTMIVQVNGLPAASGDTVGLLFNPERAFGAYIDPTIEVFEVKVGSGGYWDEINSVMFGGIAEWQDTAGVKVLYLV